MGQRSGSTGGVSREKTGRGGSEVRAIVLSHENVVAGILFHLIDLDHATGVDEETTRRTVRRLDRKGFKAVVGRAEWEGMNDGQRLDWLLAVSETTYVLRADRVAVLGRR